MNSDTASATVSAVAIGYTSAASNDTAIVAVCFNSLITVATVCVML
jgi:hypothetical protein